ncbi:hypothetical protein [Streptomyces sp. NPDC055287]
MNCRRSRSSYCQQAEAAQHRQNADTEATKAQNTRTKAEFAEGAAVERKNRRRQGPRQREGRRDAAWEAE